MYNINTGRWFVLAEDVCRYNDDIDVDMEKGVVRIAYHDKEDVAIELPPSPFRRFDSITSEKNGAGEYTVQKGDTLWSIAKRHYGDGNEWRRIQRANQEKIDVDGHIRAGMVIVLP